jgi:hypothetical protein
MPAVSSASHAQIVRSSDTSGWRAVRQGANFLTDPLNDSQTGDNEGELVGTTTVPLMQALFVPGSPSSLVDGTIYYRIRLGEDSGNAGFRGSLLLFIDAGGANAAPDVGVGIGFRNNSHYVGIFDTGPQLNQSPSTTSVTYISTIGGQAYNYAITSSPTDNSTAFYDYRLSSALQPSGFPTDLDGPVNQPVRNEPDYYLSFAIPFNDLVNYLSTKGISINENTALRYTIATGQGGQNNLTLNQDVTGGATNTPWSQIIPSNPTATSSFTIPEPGTLSLFGIGVVALIGFCRRKR